MRIGIYAAEVKEEITQYLKCFIQKNKLESEENKEIDKWHTYSRLMFQWMKMRQKGRNLAEYLKIKGGGYKRVAVYGLGDTGKLCCNEILQSREIEIVYIIDQVIKEPYRGIPVILPECVNDDIDAIIITPVYCFLDIAEKLCGYTSAKFISLEDMVVVLNGYEGQKYIE